MKKFHRLLMGCIIVYMCVFAFVMISNSQRVEQMRLQINQMFCDIDANVTIEVEGAYKVIRCDK